MKRITITAAALGALALAACAPAENETAEDAATAGVETSTETQATGGAMAPDGTTGATPDATTPVNPDGTTTPPGQTPPVLPPEPNASTSPGTTSPPPM